MKKMTKTLMFALPLAVIALGASATAEAGPGWRGQRRALHPADLNGDGVVTQREMRRSHRREARAISRRLDTNRDGWISPREFRRSKVPGYARADLDLDGFVTRVERQLGREARRHGVAVVDLNQSMRREARQAFRQLDRNGDGRIGWREARRDARRAAWDARDHHARYPRYARR